MKAGIAKTIAEEWILEHGSKQEGFLGAYFGGSTVTLPYDDELPISSDIDIMLIIALDEPPIKLGKFFYRNVLLEVTFISLKQISSMEEVLTDYHLAGGFRKDTIVADTTGYLHKLQLEVSSRFAEEDWVRRRCENVRMKIENALKNFDSSLPYYDQVTAWSFPTGITTHGILVAALRNPTVRLRYLAAREVLIEYGHEDFYLKLLELFGCSELSSEKVEKYLNNLEKLFDAAVQVAKTPFFFSTDITEIARPIAIDGSRKLIESGFHREAMFWIVATYARCHKILAADASPELQNSLMPDFVDMITDLGIASTNDFIHRREEVIRFLPKLWEIIEDIIMKNPDIVRR